MPKNRLHHVRTYTVSATVLLASLLLASCDAPVEEPAEPAANDQQVMNIGVTMSSPGLISGTDPESVSGAEVNLAMAIGEQLETINSPDDVTWIPTSRSDVVEKFDSGELDLLIGQFTGPQLTQDINWVGPYATVEAGLIVRDSSTASDDDEPVADISTLSITSLEDLAEASVCVVAGSLAHGPELPVGEATTQHSVAECEVGMRSGRYDAIAADDLQLGGLLADATTSNAYELLLWSELAEEDEDDEAQLDEELLASRQYWIGTAPGRCERSAAAFAELVNNGELEDLFSQWQETADYEPQLVEPDDLATPVCGN